MGRLTRTLAARVLQAVLVAVLVAVVSFVLVQFLPGDVAYRIAAGRYGEDLVGTAAAEAVRAELGLDRPWWSRLGAWCADLARLDLGVSLVSGERIVDELAVQLGHTFGLSIAALAVSLAIGPPLGIVAGLRAGGLVDRAGELFAAAMRALPAFVVGLILMLVFAVGLNWLPAAGVGGLAEYVLPTLTLALTLAALSSRVTRNAVLAVARAPYFAFGRLKGLGAVDNLSRHGLRNAAIPVVAYVGMQLVFLVEGVVVVESLFAWPGIGHALVHAVISRDVPMLQGTALVMGLLFVGLNAAIDVICLALDPRQGRR